MKALVKHTIEIGGRKIAVCVRPGAKPGIVWLGGYRSDMAGTKAVALDEWARANGLACTRHDYSGHGESPGDYRHGTISQWLEESLAVFRQFTDGPQILVGSSMGGWIALRMIQELANSEEGHRVAGLVLLAPAPDFTLELIESVLTPEQKRELETRGCLTEPSEYSADPNVYTRAFLVDGRKHLVLGGRIDTHCPVHILHGKADPDVPFSLSLRLVEHLPADDVTLTLVPDGDHRLSRPQDIDLLLRVIAGMVAQIEERNS